MAFGQQLLAGLGGASRLPEAQHDHGGGQARQGRDDVGELDGDVVGGDELRDGEDGTDDQCDRPTLLHSPFAVDEKAEEQRDHQGDERCLASDDGTDVLIVDAGQRPGGDDRCGDRAEGHRGGVGDQHSDRCTHPGEPDCQQHHAGDGQGGAETGQRLEHAAEAEGDEDGLDPGIVRDAVDDGAEIEEASGTHREFVEPDGGDHDPHDREQSEDGALGRGQPGEADGHVVDEDGDDQ